jgi:class 3 adenylate cyclase
MWFGFLGFILCVQTIRPQDKFKADSLEQLYLTKTLSILEQLDVLTRLAQNSPDPDKSLLYSEKLIALAKSQKSDSILVDGLLQKGNALTLKGDLSLALQSFFEGVELVEESNDLEKLGLFYVAIAGAYSVMDNESNTVLYYRKAIEALKKSDNQRAYATAIENLGDEYSLFMGKPDSALYYFEQSGKIFKELDFKLGLAYNLGNKGLAYAQIQRQEEAETNITEAIEMLEELGDYYAISVYLTYMSDIYLEKGNYKAAVSYAENSLRLAQKYSLKDQIANAYLKLSELNEYKGNFKSSFDNYKNYITYRDSVKNVSVSREISKIRELIEAEKEIIEAEREKKEAELERDLAIQKERNQRNVAIGIGVALFLIGLLAFGLYRRTLFISKTKKIIEAERNRSDELLLNILPEQTAIELKQSGTVEARKYESVSVLFSDFKGYTNYAEDLSPELLVKSLSFYFSEFDNIIEKNGLEKIKTIGDAYMCAGGLPFPDKDHAKKITRAAQEMIDFVELAKNDVAKDYANFDIRIGINSGPVVAGVVGSKKYSYDIWGDTVNVASRMESMSEVGRINISEKTYHLIKSDFECEYRGEYDIKNRGKLKMYFVNSAGVKI